VKSNLPSEILDIRYVGGEDWPLLEYADKFKRRRIIQAPFMPYFFIKKRDLRKSFITIEKHKAEVEVRPEKNYVSTTGDKCVKVSVTSPRKVKRGKKREFGLRPSLEAKGVKTFESDIPFAAKRVIVDCDVKQCDILTRAYVDTEVDARKGFPDPNKAPFRIISFSIVGTDGKEYFISYSDELEMMYEAQRILNRNYSMVTAWNWRKFDGLYWKNRAAKIGFNFNLSLYRRPTPC